MVELATDIYRSIELREYDRLEKLARAVIIDNGWKRFLEVLSESQTNETNILGWNIPLRKGPLRDALIRLLKLELIIGLDCDYIKRFNQIESNDLDEVRNQAFPIIIDLFHEQIERQNTFFLDPKAFSTTPYAVFVKDIINARTKEIEELPLKPTLREVYSTYYGFTILTTGGTSGYHAGAAEKGVKLIEDLAAQFGKQARLKARIFQRSSKSFPNCTKDTKTLLWNLLRVCNGGWDARSNASKILGMMGDSRATDILITNLKNARNHYEKLYLVNALGAIGNPKALDILIKHLDHSSLRKAVLVALGGIRHPDAINKLIQIVGSGDKRVFGFAIAGLGESRSTEALEYLASLIDNRKGRPAAQIFEALSKMGPRGLDEIVRRPNKVARVLRSGAKPHQMIHILRCIPDFQWTPEIKKSIARKISHYYSGPKIINEIIHIPELVTSKPIIDAVLKIFESSIQYRWYQWRARRLLESSKVTQFLANAIITSDDPHAIISRITRRTELGHYPEIRNAIRIITEQEARHRSLKTKQQSLSPYTRFYYEPDVNE